MSLQRDSLFDVSGKVAVITGGGTGIGLMMAMALEHNGALVYILGRRMDTLEEAAGNSAKNGKIIPLQCDVTSQDEILSAVKRIEKEVGYIDILVNNSGISMNHIKDTSPDLDIKAFRDNLWNAGTPEDFSMTWEVNVKAIYYTTVAFLELLDAGNRRHNNRDEPKSQVVITSSITSIRRDAATSRTGCSYSASKAAATHLGKTFASLLAPYKIRSNVIEPGIFPSQITTTILQNNPSGHVSASANPVERWGSAEDMGGLILFLASRAGGYVNGGVFVTDGGRHGIFAKDF